MLVVAIHEMFYECFMQLDIQKQPVTARVDEKLQQTMTLTTRRLDIHQQVHTAADIHFRAGKNLGFLEKVFRF